MQNSQRTLTDSLINMLNKYVDTTNPKDKTRITGGVFGTLDAFHSGNRIIFNLHGLTRYADLRQSEGIINAGFSIISLDNSAALERVYFGNISTDFSKSPTWCEQKIQWLFHHLSRAGHNRVLSGKPVYRAIANITYQTKTKSTYTFRGVEISEKEYELLPEIIKREVRIRTTGNFVKVKKGDFLDLKAVEKLQSAMLNSVVKFELLKNFNPVNYEK